MLSVFERPFLSVFGFISSTLMRAFALSVQVPSRSCGNAPISQLTRHHLAAPSVITYSTPISSKAEIIFFSEGLVESEVAVIRGW